MVTRLPLVFQPLWGSFLLPDSVKLCAVDSVWVEANVSPGMIPPEYKRVFDSPGHSTI